MTCERVSRLSELWSFCPLDVSLSVERQQFLKSEEIVLVILLALTNRTLNRLGFGMLNPLEQLGEQLCFDCIC